MNHHPSCKPSDRDLIFKCHQCGLEESAAKHQAGDVELYEDMDAWRARATKAEANLQQERVEKKVTQEKLAQMIRERDDLQLKMDLGG